MCGIFGILTTVENTNIFKIILDGLIQLQNRGYDSSGLCTINDGEFEIHKYASDANESSIDKLLLLPYTDHSKCVAARSVGIGHNRWATHGAKTDTNAHPHISNDKQFVIVHNGIIENYQALKSFLIDAGFTFYSQTDTEVIVNLLSYYYSTCKNAYRSIQQTICALEGTYGLIILNILEPETVYAVRNGSPLLIGVTDEYAIISSEQSGFCNKVSTYITLNNDDICTISIKRGCSKISINTASQYNQNKVSLLNYDLTPAPYKHWTLKEINEQPNTILNSINRGGRIKNASEVKLGGLERHTETLKNIENIIILGCGTSYNAGLYGMHYLKHMCRFNTVQVFDGAEFSEYDIPKTGSTACIFISQSGETKDLHRCIEIAKNHNLFTIGIINVVDSLIAREVDCGIYCNAGREMGVASTKAFTSQVICLSLFAIWHAQITRLNEPKRMKMITDLHNLSNDFKNTVESVDAQMQQIAGYMMRHNHLFILGKGTDECIAREGSLKIKEISYVHSESYSASSLKHGPFALLDENFPVILINCHQEHNAKIMNCFEEIRARHSPVTIITNNIGAKEFGASPSKGNGSVGERLNSGTLVEEFGKGTIVTVANNTTYGSLLGIVPLQLLAYYLSIGKGINPDIPKNLAKVVTVE